MYRLQTAPNKAYSLLTNPTDVQFLTNYANNTENIGYGGAQALLEFVTAATFDIPRFLPEQNGGARLLNNQTNNDAKLTGVEADNIKIYPNPTNGILNVECKNFNDGELIVIEITNTLGQVVQTTKILTQTTAINIQHLNSGIYMLKAYCGKTKLYQSKIVKVN